MNKHVEIISTPEFHDWAIEEPHLADPPAHDLSVEPVLYDWADSLVDSGQLDEDYARRERLRGEAGGFIGHWIKVTKPDGRPTVSLVGTTIEMESFNAGDLTTPTELARRQS